MSKVTRTNKQIFDIAGTITGPDGLKVDVRFDLMELEDLIDGVPGPRFSYGVLRFQETLGPSLSERLLSAAPLILTGGGIHASLCLYKLDSFTLTDTIREFSAHTDGVAA